MTATNAREVYQLLAGSRIRCWIVGGWGIDALLGRETRPRTDLDVLLVRGEHARAWELLHQAGFTLDLSWEESTDVACGGVGGSTLPTAYVLVDRYGRQVDVHVLDDDLAPLWTTERTFGTGALAGKGTIDGIEVSCMSKRMQRIAHTGYPLPEDQRRDLDLLAEDSA